MIVLDLPFNDAGELECQAMGLWIFEELDYIKEANARLKKLRDDQSSLLEKVR